jgi:hypothetical protein
MNNQFNTLIQSYHDNFLQYKITGNASYQSAYQSAQQTIEGILNNLESQNSEQRKVISSFYDENHEEKLREIAADEKNAQRRVIEQHDKLKAAEMRNIELTPPSTNYLYYIAGGLIVMGLLISRN